MKFDLQVSRKTFSELLRPNNPMEIPPFQRPYSWKPEQWGQLWEDLTVRLDQDYLMGGIVLCGTDNGNDFVIDGQQRLSTISLLIAVCRDYLWRECGSDKAKQSAIGIHNQYIVSGGVDAEKNEPFLVLGELDRDWFAEKIQVSPAADGEYYPPDVAQVKNKIPGSSRLLWRAYQFFHKQIVRRHSTNAAFLTIDSKIEDVKRITRHLGTRNWFMVTRVPDDTQAYTLFEVLNDRGLELSISDLIKNVILARASEIERLPKAKEHWSNIVEALDYENIAAFLRYFWMSHNGKKTTEDKLFETLKNDIKKMNASTLITFLKGLSEEAENFAEIIGRSEINEDITRELELINSYGFRVGNSLFLAVWACAKDEDVRLDVLREVKNFLVKFAVFANQVTNELEIVMADLSAAVRKDLKSGLELMRAKFKKSLPSNKTIEDGFLKLEPSSAVARAILTEIEISLTGTEKLASGPSKVNVEHIFPQSASDKWKESFGANDEEESYVARLGNLTLLDAKLNRQASNKPYSDKQKTYYVKSDFTITKQLPKGNHWTIKSVEDRQAELFKSAKEIWQIG